jgi:opacity protein-like surface antigen
VLKEVAMKTMIRCLAAAALACALAPAQADDVGPYAQLALGRTTYDFDCNFYGCNGARANGGKVGGGYRFGVFAIEAWATDWGRGPIVDYVGNDAVRLRSLGVGAAWRMHFGSWGEGVLRTGIADVQQVRSVESFRHLEGTFGLGLSFTVAPKVAAELGWDLTTSTGGSDRIGSAIAQMVTLGLQLRF